MMSSAHDDEPFGGVNACLVVDVRTVSPTQFQVGAALWRPRKDERPEDRGDLQTKHGAPSRTITLFEFREDSDDMLNLDSLVVREKPRWVYVNPRIGVKEMHRIHEMMQRSGVGVALPTKDNSFKWPKADAGQREELEAELAGALNASDLHGHVEVMALTTGLNALSCLMSELRSLGLLSSVDTGGMAQEASEGDGPPPSNFHELKLGRLDSCMRLDSAAADAIMLLPDKKAPNSSSGSIFGVLNQTKTGMGARLLEGWLRQPLVDRAAIEARHDLVGALKDEVELRGALTDALRACPDLELIVAKLRRSATAATGGSAKGRAASLSDLLKLYNFALRNLPSFNEALEGSGGEASSALTSRFGAPLKQCLADLGSFKALMEHVMDFSALPDLRIKPEHRPELAELAEDMERAEAEVREVHEAVGEEWAGVKAGSRGSIRLEAHKEEGFVMRLPSASDEQLLRKEIPQISILSILKSGVVFTTQELRAAAGEHVAASCRYAEEQNAVVEKVIATAATYVPVTETAARLVSPTPPALACAWSDRVARATRAPPQP